MDELASVLRLQDGVVSRRQLLDLGSTPSDIARMLRRRELASTHPGVFVDHTGPLTWQQRAWAGVLFSWPAALTHQSALRAGEGPGRRDRDDSIIEIAVERGRRLVAPDRVRLRRTAGFSERVQWNLGPPRVRFDDAVIDVADSAASEIDAIAALADACGARRTTGARLLIALAARPRLARRAWLTEVLADVASGSCSVLEHGYLTRVERAHGLPVGRRQVSHRHGDSQLFRDVEYDGLDIVVELDGRLFHESARARDLDMDRDLDASIDGRETIRLSYGQVFDRACSTTAKLAALFTRRGWEGQAVRCPECG